MTSPEMKLLASIKNFEAVEEALKLFVAYFESQHKHIVDFENKHILTTDEVLEIVEDFTNDMLIR